MRPTAASDNMAAGMPAMLGPQAFVVEQSL